VPYRLSAALVTPQVIQATLNRGLPAWQVRGDQLIIPWPGGIRVDYLDNHIGHGPDIAHRLPRTSGRSGAATPTRREDAWRVLVRRPLGVPAARPRDENERSMRRNRRQAMRRRASRQPNPVSTDKEDENPHKANDRRVFFTFPPAYFHPVAGATMER
jgi:hypothetical protein